MQQKLQKVRGTRDLFGDEARAFRAIDSRFAEIAKIYDFQEMETPIFESTQVFQRTLGEQSDIVNKEMYTFIDRSGDSLTLRPEGTASVARAAIEHGLLREPPLKLFYSGPMFRHERPQKGRYRQFRQFGIELIGVDRPLADIEVLNFAWDFFVSFNMQSKVQLEINSIGDRASREGFKQELVRYLQKYQKDLSEDSQKRLQTNPLRILDSKEATDQKITESAPQFGDFLNDESKSFFARVLNGLEKLNIPYVLNPRLVRGLDYYNHTVFEFTTTELGSQNAVLSGGRYNNLIEEMGGPKTPAVGWASGMDRLVLMLEAPPLTGAMVAVIATDEGGEGEALLLLSELRKQGIPSQPIYSGNVSKQLKKADKRGCTHVVLIGDKETQNKTFLLKDLKAGSQLELNKNQLFQSLQDQLA